MVGTQAPFVAGKVARQGDKPECVSTSLDTNVAKEFLVPHRFVALDSMRGIAAL